MKISSKGLFLAALQVTLVAGTAAKLRYDRATLPRVWVKSAPYDPNLPIRGRYVRMSIEVENPEEVKYGFVELKVEHGRLVAHRSDHDTGNQLSPGGSQSGRLAEAVAFFISEHMNDPSRREADEELWVEVTVPRRGPPRPIRLGIMKNGILTPSS